MAKIHSTHHWGREKARERYAVGGPPRGSSPTPFAKNEDEWARMEEARDRRKLFTPSQPTHSQVESAQHEYGQKELDIGKDK